MKDIYEITYKSSESSGFSADEVRVLTYPNISHPTHTNLNDSHPTHYDFFEVIKINEKGFYYKGEFIEDAGKAHSLLIKVLEGKVL